MSLQVNIKPQHELKLKKVIVLTAVLMYLFFFCASCGGKRALQECSPRSLDKVNRPILLLSPVIRGQEHFGDINTGDKQTFFTVAWDWENDRIFSKACLYNAYGWFNDIGVYSQKADAYYFFIAFKNALFAVPSKTGKPDEFIHISEMPGFLSPFVTLQGYIIILHSKIENNQNARITVFDTGSNSVITENIFIPKMYEQIVYDGNKYCFFNILTYDEANRPFYKIYRLDLETFEYREIFDTPVDHTGNLFFFNDMLIVGSNNFLKPREPEGWYDVNTDPQVFFIKKETGKIIKQVRFPPEEKYYYIHHFFDYNGHLFMIYGVNTLQKEPAFQVENHKWFYQYDAQLNRFEKIDSECLFGFYYTLTCQRDRYVFLVYNRASDFDIYKINMENFKREFGKTVFVY
ncbi:MAG: hypothetical protein JW969_06945 [Spirochaetales bacterium]|nr:hypothetical protein [Spirochaetales bacterium]